MRIKVEGKEKRGRQSRFHFVFSKIRGPDEISGNSPASIYANSSESRFEKLIGRPMLRRVTSTDSRSRFNDSKHSSKGIEARLTPLYLGLDELTGHWKSSYERSSSPRPAFSRTISSFEVSQKDIPP